MSDNWFWDELEKASEDFQKIPTYLRPVVTCPRGWGKQRRMDEMNKAWLRGYQAGHESARQIMEEVLDDLDEYPYTVRVDPETFEKMLEP